ncbi:MAG: GNAT family N-acetyltransferase [Terracidiphilus sp.]
MFEVSQDRTRMDIEFIHGFLSRSSYWAQDRSRAAVEKTIQHSMCFGVFDKAKQIAFGRLVTDCVAFGYLADVFVAPEYRGKGVGKILLNAIVNDPIVRDLTVVLLRTKDAHSLYKQFGFASLRNVEEMMGRYKS